MKEGSEETFEALLPPATSESVDESRDEEVSIWLDLLTTCCKLGTVFGTLSATVMQKMCFLHIVDLCFAELFFWKTIFCVLVGCFIFGWFPFFSLLFFLSVCLGWCLFFCLYLYLSCPSPFLLLSHSLPLLPLDVTFQNPWLTRRKRLEDISTILSVKFPLCHFVWTFSFAAWRAGEVLHLKAYWSCFHPTLAATPTHTNLPHEGQPPHPPFPLRLAVCVCNLTYVTSSVLLLTLLTC